MVVVTCRPSVLSCLLGDVEQVEQFLGDLPFDQPVRPGGLVLVARA